MGQKSASMGMPLVLAGVVVAACTSSSSGSPAPAPAADDAAAVSAVAADAPADTQEAADSAGPDHPPVHHKEAATTDAGPDGVTDRSLDADAGPDAVTDADVCTPLQVLRYESPGCGVDAVAVCGGFAQDACANRVCGCDGTDVVMCDYSPVPWAHVGSCSGAADPSSK